MHVAKLGLEGNIPSLFYGDETYCVLLVDPGQNLISILLLTTELETLAPSWAIFNTLAHLTSTLAWEKWVVSNHI
jgi:hypothetical protein